MIQIWFWLHWKSMGFCVRVIWYVLIVLIQLCTFSRHFFHQFSYDTSKKVDVWIYGSLIMISWKYRSIQMSFNPECNDALSKTCVVKCAVKTESALFLLWKTFITLVFVTPLPQLLFIQSQLFRVEKPSKILRAESLLI